MAERLLGYLELCALLQKYGIAPAPARLVHSPAQAGAAAREIGFPAALKLISPAHSHKSEGGFVILNLTSQRAIRQAARRLLEKAAGQPVEGLLVQKMAPGGVETLAGISRDAQFGLVVAFGPGGILVELLDEAALRLAPLSAWEAQNMIRETRAWRLLQGYRGAPPADWAALADLLVRLGRLAGDLQDELISLDLNPVFVLPEGQGLFVADARAAVRA